MKVRVAEGLVVKPGDRLLLVLHDTADLDEMKRLRDGLEDRMGASVTVIAGDLIKGLALIPAEEPAAPRHLIGSHAFRPLSESDDVCAVPVSDEDDEPCGWPRAEHERAEGD